MCDKLGKGSKDPIVKQVFSKASENSQTAMYSVDKLMQTAHEAPQEEAEAPSTKRKRRDSGDKKIERHARDGTTKWTDTTCKCGVEKHTKEELWPISKGGMMMANTCTHTKAVERKPNSHPVSRILFSVHHQWQTLLLFLEKI